MSTPLDEQHEQRRAGLRRDLVHGSLWTLGAALFSLPLSFAANFVVVRALGPGEFARFAVFTAALAIVMTIVNAGVTSATSQELAVAHAAGDHERTVALLRRCSGFFALIETPAVVVLTVIVLRGTSALVIVGTALACALAFVLSTALVALTGSARNAAAARATLATTVLGQFGVAAVALLTHRADLCWGARIASLALAPIVAFWHLSPEHRRAVLRPALPVGFGRTFRSNALAFWALSVTALLLLDRTEIFVLQWNDEITAVAVFALATTLTAQLTVPMDSLMGPLAPTSAALVSSDASSGARILTSTLRVSSVCGAFTAAVALPALVAIVPVIFGSTYGRTVALFALGIVSVLDSSATPVRALAFATRAASGVLRVTALGLVLDVALALTLIPLLGLVGAVVALAAGQGVFVLLLVRLVARRLGTHPATVLGATRVSVVGAACGVGAYLLTGANGLPPVAHAACAAVVGGLLLVGVLRVSGRLHLRLDDADLQRVVVVLPERLGRVVVRGARLLSLAETRSAQ